MDTLFTDGHFWVGPSATDWATELFVSQGRVAEKPNRPERLATVKLGGKYVYPSFRDGHAHPLQAARENLGPKLTGLTSIAEIVAALKTFAEGNPNLDWIVGGTYNRDLLPDGRFEAAMLDAAESNRPVILHSNDHHALWLNTEALRRAGLLLSQPALQSGSIDVDETGRATGVLREWPAMNLVLQLLPETSPQDRLTQLAWAENELLRHGITEVQDAWVDENDFDTYLAAAEIRLLKVKTHLAFVLTPANWTFELEQIKAAMDSVEASNNPLLVLNGAKIFIDGSLGNGTAALLDPYHSSNDGSEFGELLWLPENLVEALTQVRLAGLQPHLHAIGDAAVRFALDALEAAAEASPLGLPAVVAHAELIADADIHRFKSLSATANLQPLWARQDEMMRGAESKLGRHRAEKLYRMRDLIESGAALSFGSDWPVSELNPLAGIATAVSRQTPNGQPRGGWTPQQALNLPEALMAYSAGTSAQLGNSSAGTLRHGQSADFQVLDKNVFDLPPLELHNLEVQAVYVSGELVFTQLK